MTLRDALDRPLPLQDVVSRLKQVDDRLDLRYVAYRSRDGANLNLDERWAIILRWAETDKRRLMIQRGDMSEEGDFDVLAYLPLDCAPDQAYGYFMSAAKQFHRPADVERMLSRIHKYNDDAKTETLKETTDLAEELIEANAGSLFKEQGKTTAKVYLSEKKK